MFITKIYVFSAGEKKDKPFERGEIEPSWKMGRESGKLESIKSRKKDSTRAFGSCRSSIF